METEGKFCIDQKGERIHGDLLRLDDRLRDTLVAKLVEKAIEENRRLAELKANSFLDVENHFETLREQYGLKPAKSAKGNLTLIDFSGLNKVELRSADTIVFDEKLSLAKEACDVYLNEITKRSRPEIKTLITKAFEVDKKGRVCARKVLALKQIEIDDERWRKVIELIDESVCVTGSRSYIRFYTRATREEEWSLVSLDLAGV